jgi:D-erythronate 2-dehydrogenase
MHVLIIGAAGMIGRKLTRAICETGKLGDRAVTALTLVDVAEPEMPTGLTMPLRRLALDFSAPGAAERLVADRPDIIVHLAAIVSGQAEADFDLGYRVNLDGTRALFDAIRHLGTSTGYCPRVVFTSSLAVFGAPVPEVIGDTHFLTPMTSYGTQKAIGELLLDDYTRRGFFDGIGIRLPTICIRPGAPNKAASGFFSSILREPLAGLPAVLPVPASVRHWHASPRAAVGFLIHAATMDTAPMGHRRNLMMPGLLASVEEQIEALRRVAGQKAVDLIESKPDEAIARIIANWPQGFDPRRARALGFTADVSFDEIIQLHIADEMGGRLP